MYFKCISQLTSICIMDLHHQSGSVDDNFCLIILNCFFGSLRYLSFSIRRLDLYQLMYLTNWPLHIFLSSFSPLSFMYPYLSTSKFLVISCYSFFDLSLFFLYHRRCCK